MHARARVSVCVCVCVYIQTYIQISEVWGRTAITLLSSAFNIYLDWWLSCIMLRINNRSNWRRNKCACLWARMHKCVCVCVCVRVCVCACRYIIKRVRMRARVYKLYLWVRVCICSCISLRVYVCERTCWCMSVLVAVCVFITSVMLKHRQVLSNNYRLPTSFT